MYMSLQGLEEQNNCQVTEKSNYQVALNNADSVDNAINAFNRLVDKAELHQQNAMNELERVEDDRHRTALELLGYKIVLIIGAVISIL